MNGPFSKIGRAFRAYVLRDPNLLTARRWLRVRGDETLRLDYPLGLDDLVFDCGGYRGDFAARIVERYGCRVWLFEPVPQFHATCAKRFAGDPRVRCLPFGLAATSGRFGISAAADGSSLHAGSTELEVEVVEFARFLEQESVSRISLVKLNIEGAEYDLLDHLLDRGLATAIRDLQIQFHDFVPAAAARRGSIRRRLAATHSETWCFPFVWENWRRTRAGATPAD